MKSLLSFLCAGFLSAALFPVPGVLAQDLRELQWSDVTGITYLFDDPTRSLLIVESTVDNLSFESNRVIISADLKEPGIWHVILEPGVQLIKIRADGFLPLELPRYNYQRQRVRRIRVTAFGASAGFDVNRPELRLLYTPRAQDEEVYVQLDNKPPQIMKFADGSVSLRPTVGEHRVRVFAGGRKWETTLSMDTGGSYEETVEFTSGATETLTEVQPGNLFIESTPSGATVFLNQVEQRGVTPLTLNDLRPGIYEIEIVHDLYLPETRTVEVKELDYTNVNVDLTPNFGHLLIDTKPTGALVYINDQQRGITPLDIPRFNAGQYRLRLVQQLYYEEIDTFRIEPGGEFIHTYDLKPQFGSLTVTSTPSGAEVEVDGARLGVTPVTKDQVVSGKHVVHVSKENYYEQEKEIEIFDGIHREMPFLLSSSVGYLTVESTPPGAVVSVVETGKRLGTTPLHEIVLDPGIYTVRLELEKYEPYEQSVPVALAGTPSIKVDLVRKTGHLRVESTPPKATIYLNNEKRGTTPTLLRDVPTGTYTIRLQKSGYDIQESTVNIKHNKITDFRISLGTAGTEEWKERRRKARMLSIVPGGGQFSTEGQWWRGALYTGGIAVTGYLAYQANADYTDAEHDYNVAKSSYQNAVGRTSIDNYYTDITSAYDKMDTSQKKLNMFLIAAGGVYAVSVIDAWLFGGGAKPVTVQTADAQADAQRGWKPYAAATPTQIQMGLRFEF